MPKLIISAKCSDRFSMTYSKQTTVKEERESNKYYDGYVPNIIPNSFGDSIELEIDVESGKILNWNTTVVEVDKFFAEQLPENE